MGLATPHPIPRALWEPQTASFMQIRSDRLVERITQSPLAVRQRHENPGPALVGGATIHTSFLLRTETLGGKIHPRPCHNSEGDPLTPSDRVEPQLLSLWQQMSF